MITITYKGANAVKISSKKTNLIADPKLSLIGLKDLDVKDEVQLVTDSRLAVPDATSSVTFSSPGEYEVGDFTISGVAVKIATDINTTNGTAYRITGEDITIALLGNIAPVLDESQLEAIGMVDILIIPVGGNGYTLDAKDAARLTKQIEPKIVIPVHYADNGVAYEVPQDEINLFTKEIGSEVTDLDALKIKSVNDMPQSLSTFVIHRS